MFPSLLKWSFLEDSQDAGSIVSSAPPWNSLPPERVDRVDHAPVLRPNSAE
jgi:hypothetical protein